MVKEEIEGEGGEGEGEGKEELEFGKEDFYPCKV